MVNRFTCMALALLSALLLGGNSVQADEPLKVTMIAYPPGDDFYFTVENSARAQAERSDVDLTVQKIPSYDLSAQIAVLNATIATKPDAIIVSPLDINGLQGALEKAKSLGIKIVLYDTSTRDPSVAATYVSANIVELGREAAHEFQKLAGTRTGSVFYQGTAPAQPFFDSLHAGWQEVLSTVPGYKHLPINYSDFEPAKAASQMQAVLTATPDLIGGFTGIYTDQQGNVPAIERAGKLNDLVLIGLDGAPQNVERLRQGKLDAIVSVKARDYGTEAIKAAVAAVEGKELPQKTLIGRCLLTAETLSDPENDPCLYDLAKQ
jgi:ribose transport system substrate-binding protein